MNLVLKCAEDNDLYRVLLDQDAPPPRYSTLPEALDAAPAGAGLLVLADAYPRPSQAIDNAFLATASDKDLRLYLEYPASLPGMDIGDPRAVQWERMVVASGFFQPDLGLHTILASHGCWFLPVRARCPHLVLARVAGYRRAVYGLPDETYPALFEYPGENALVASTGLSRFVTGRYAPTSAWKALWERLLCWLSRTHEVPSLAWTPTVGLQAGPGKPREQTAETDAFCRSVHWFREQAVFSIDDKKGAIEGFESAIDPLGRQMRRTLTRADCTAETGMVFAWDWACTRNPACREGLERWGRCGVVPVTSTSRPGIKGQAAFPSEKVTAQVVGDRGARASGRGREG